MGARKSDIFRINRSVRNLAFVLGGIAVVAFSFWATLAILDATSGRQSIGNAPSPQRPATAESSIPDLTPVPGSNWIGVAGINVQPVTGEPLVSNFRIVRLTAIPKAGRHSIAAEVDGLAKRTYRITAWVKPQPGANFRIEAGDHSEPKQSHIATVFDLKNHKIDGAGGMEPRSQDWQKVWVDLPTASGRIFINFDILRGNDVEFAGDGVLGIVFAGFAVD